MSSTTEVPPPIDPNIDPYAYLGFTKNPHDGSVARAAVSAASAGPFRPSDPVPGLSKDIPINPLTNTWARIYLPSPAAPPAKLPLIVYFHGGGFVACSAATSIFHTFCSDIAAAVSAVVVSVDYRLAPEHRLPAAYDDCFEALQWVTAAADNWLADYADFSNCFLMGSSAGGNIAYHVGLRAAVDLDLPVKIRGLILHQPFFGGAARTASETRAVGDKMFPPCVAEAMWELSLPVGADREHEYCNPMRAIGLEAGLEKIRDEGWRLLVTGCEGDLFVDRQIEFVEMLMEKGVCVVDEFSEGGFHGVEHFDESRAKIFYGVVKSFVNCD